MSGEENSEMQTVKERLTAREKQLDELERQIGLPVALPPGTDDELNKYLSMPRELMEKLDVEDCAQIAARLQQYAFYLQRLTNADMAKREWLVYELKRSMAEETAQFLGSKYMTYEERLELAISENDYGTRLRAAEVYAKQRIDRLFHLSAQLNKIADSFINIQRSKTRYGRD